MILTKPLDMNDLNTPEFVHINSLFNKYFGSNWPEVPLRRWEYIAAIIFTGILSHSNTIKILEAGAGCSVFTPFLALNGFNVESFDISGKHRRVERNIKYHVEDRVHEHDMNLLDIEFDDNHFDFVFCISAIEHVNAGHFGIPRLAGCGDCGHMDAMHELARVLKPGGLMFLTTDYADKYYPPPGLWKSGSHRIFDRNSIEDLVAFNNLRFFGKTQFSMDWSKLNRIEPVGYDYTTFAMTLCK